MHQIYPNIINGETKINFKNEVYTHIESFLAELDCDYGYSITYAIYSNSQGKLFAFELCYDEAERTRVTEVKEVLSETKTVYYESKKYNNKLYLNYKN